MSKVTRKSTLPKATNAKFKDTLQPGEATPQKRQTKQSLPTKPTPIKDAVAGDVMPRQTMGKRPRPGPEASLHLLHSISQGSR